VCLGGVFHRREARPVETYRAATVFNDGIEKRCAQNADAGVPRPGSERRIPWPMGVDHVQKRHIGGDAAADLGVHGPPRQGLGQGLGDAGDISEMREPGSGRPEKRPATGS
jgi:hypothetical protein